MRLSERIERLTNSRAIGMDLGLATGGRPKDRWNANGAHNGENPSPWGMGTGDRRLRRPLAGSGAERFVIRKDAHLLVRDLARIAGADGAVRIAPHLEL